MNLFSRIDWPIPVAAMDLLARREWFDDPSIFLRIRLAKAGWAARFLSNRAIAGTNISAITLGHTIYFRPGKVIDFETPKGLALLAHEVKHVEQYEREGWLKFCANYLIAYFKYGYGELIPYEAEAYALSRRVAAQLEAEGG